MTTIQALGQLFLQSVQGIPALDDVELMQKYQHDASGLQGNLPPLVLRPRTTEQVVQIVKACHQFKQPYVVQGGLTGLAGGATVQNNEVVISLEQMNQIEEIDTLGGTVCVQAGVILETLHQAVEAQNWYFPLDLGARGSCTIGGNISTNAGGNRVFRYGTTRDLVLGLEVVLPDGTVLNMLKSLVKNNTGMDLKHLFIGTEGRYGIVTRAILRLFPAPQERLSALLALNQFTDVAQLLVNARQSLPELSSFEVMWRSYLESAAQIRKREVPFNGQYELYVLLEIEGQSHDFFRQRFEHFLEQVVNDELVQDVIVPQSVEQTAALWDIRDASSELMHSMKPFVAFDIGIPLNQMQAFIEECMAEVEKGFPHAKNVLFGHLGDGNLHLSSGLLKEEELTAVDELVYQVVSRYNGSITAEHGIGVIKKPFLHYSRSADEVRIMQALRHLFNSENLLNSGRVVD